MSGADQAGVDVHLAMLAYMVTLRGPGNFSPAGTITQCKFRALLLIKKHLSTQLNVRKEIMIQQRQTGEALWLYSMKTPRASAEPSSLCTVGSQTFSLAKSSGHQDAHMQKPKGLSGPDQLKSQVYQEQRIHSTSSGAYELGTIHIDAAGGTTSKQAITTHMWHKCSTPAFSAHSKTESNIAETTATDFRILGTCWRDTLILLTRAINTGDQYCKHWGLLVMQELCTLPETLNHSIDVGSNVYNTLLVCKETGILHNNLVMSCTLPQLDSCLLVLPPKI